MMLILMILRRGRRFPDAAHQCQGTSDPSPAATTTSSSPAAASTSGGGARRHPAGLKHPEEPCRHVRLCDTLIPCCEKRILRPFPALPAIHPPVFRFPRSAEFFLARARSRTISAAPRSTTDLTSGARTRQICRDNFGISICTS